MNLKSQTGDPRLKVPPRRVCVQDFYVLNPRTLDLEAVTLPRDHRVRPTNQATNFNETNIISGILLMLMENKKKKKILCQKAVFLEYPGSGFSPPTVCSLSYVKKFQPTHLADYSHN